MKEFHRTIFFTKAPLGGYYRYKDEFQVFPCDMKNMPVSKLQKHHPNILEFWTTEDEIIKTDFELEELQEAMDKTAIVILKQEKILALLTAFTNNLFFKYTDISGTWGIPILKDEPGEEANTWESKWCLNMYHFPDLPRQFKITDFTEPQVPIIERILHKDFYTKEPNLDAETQKNIVLPLTIDQLFDSYYSLDPEISFFIDTACSYTVSAIELHYKKKTLSLLSSFTAMETMVNLENKDFKPEKCTTCSQLRYSVNKKFTEYLMKYIGDSTANKKKFNNYYSIRSKIVHTGKQLKAELLFTDILKDEKESERMTRIEILQLGKLAITNWLLNNKKEKFTN